MRFATLTFFLAAALMTPGCAGLIAAGSATGAIGGSLALANEAAQLAGNTLSDGARLACAIQHYANAKEPPDPELSYQAGLFCSW